MECFKRSEVRMNKEERLIESGRFKILPNGEIWRIKKAHGKGVRVGGGYQKGTQVYPCHPVRAELLHVRGHKVVICVINGMKFCASAHRLIWTFFNGPIPRHRVVTHKNRNSHDNRIINLTLKKSNRGPYLTREERGK